MVDLIDVRVSKLVRISDHCRHLANGVLPFAVRVEIAEMADEYDTEVARIERDCRGKRRCPCECSGGCLPFE